MKISIVLTTYNGINFLEKQMKSLLNQSVNAYEVIIFDDCSTDGTQELIKNFIQKNNLKNWRFQMNKINIGWKANFKNGFDLCTGDIIFPADQDDIWNLDKLEKMVQCFDIESSAELIVSNYKPFYEDSNFNDGYAKIAHNMVNNNQIVKINFDEKWAYINRPGCVFAFKKSFYDEIKYSWNTNFAHDANLWRAAIIKGTLYRLNYSTIQFRRHKNNVTGVKNCSRKFKIEQFNELKKVYSTYYNFAQIYGTKESLKIIEQGIDFLNMRLRFFNSKNILIWIILFIKYRKHYMNNQNVFGDFIYCYRREI